MTIDKELINKEDLIDECIGQMNKYHRLADYEMGEFQRTQDDSYMKMVDFYFDKIQYYEDKLESLGVDPNDYYDPYGHNRDRKHDRSRKNKR